MPEKKKQHYIPKLYMRLFTHNQKDFAVLNISNRKILNSVPYGSHCYKDYYYGKDGIWENRLAEMESDWLNTFQLVLSKAPLTAENISSLKQFALYQRQRTLAEGNYSKKIRKELLTECAKSLCKNDNLAYNDKDLEEWCAQRANESISPAETLQFATQYMSSINDLNVVIIEYKTHVELCSSDVPVIAINPFHLHTIGYGSMGLILLFPISPHHLVVIFDPKMYPQYNKKLYVELSNENEVRNLNILQLISAEEILFARNPNVFLNYKENHWSIRNKNRNSRSIHSLGSDDQKIIGTTLRKTVFDCNFSFARIHSEFKSIPFHCKEAVPRVWEKEWEDKLNTKIEMMPQIALHNPDVLKMLNLTIKEMRCGYERMARAANKYWNNAL